MAKLPGQVLHSSALVLLGGVGWRQDGAVRASREQRDRDGVPRLGGESEMELPFAEVHQLCEFGRRHLAAARPHENALSAAFGVEEGGAPDRFLVALVTVHIDEPLRSRLELLGAAGRLVHADGGDPRRADRPGPADLQAGR
jgi:hypothetical protein